MTVNKQKIIIIIIIIIITIIITQMTCSLSMYISHNGYRELDFKKGNTN